MFRNLVRNLFTLKHWSAVQCTGTITKGEALSGPSAGVNTLACLSYTGPYNFL